jgi:hypothetical protein
MNALLDTLYRANPTTTQSRESLNATHAQQEVHAPLQIQLINLHVPLVNTPHQVLWPDILVLQARCVHL